MILILGIESTCDDSSVALYCTEKKSILGEASYSSRNEHSPFGGIVPEYAARAHEKHLPRLVEECLASANRRPSDLDYIAYSAEPGLPSSLLVGRMIAVTLSKALQKPCLPINHLEAHIYSIGLTQSLSFPSLALLITGKNTSIYYLENEKSLVELESCSDCALGEAFDKVARILLLGYPGGALLEKYYKENIFVESLTKRPKDVNRLSLNFSGLITASDRLWNSLLLKEEGKNKLLSTSRKKDYHRVHVSTSFHNEVLDILSIKLSYWAFKKKVSTVFVVGGVSRNAILRQKLPESLESKKIKLVWVDNSLAEDNGSMIAYRASLLV